MRKRDPIFWAATCIFVVSLVLARVVDEGFLLMMIGAYLLRPTLHSLGFAMKLVDERQLQIHYRAGNVGFAALVIGNVVVMLALMGQNNHAWEMVNAALLIALAVRALSGLLQVGDLAVAGPRIVMAMGFLLGLFGFLEGGFSLGSLQHVIPGLAIVALGFVARKRPRTVAIVLFVLVGLLAAFLVSRALRSGRSLNWGEAVTLLLIASTVVVTATCLLRAQAASDDGPIGGAAMLVFVVSSLGSLAVPLAPVLAVAPLQLQAQGMSCEGTPKRRTDGTIERCRLAAEYRVGNIALPAGSDLTVRTSGVVLEAVLRGPTMVGGQPLPDKATLSFDSAGIPYDFFLDKSAVYKGHHLRAKDKGVGHMLYPDGKLRAIWLAEEEVIDGIPCASNLPLFGGWWHAITIGAQAMAWFYENGQLQQAMLSRDFTIQGHSFKKGDVVRLNRDGTLDLTSPKLDWAGGRPHVS